MTDSIITDDELWRIGRWGVARRGLRPVICLPESHARRLLNTKDILEVAGIILYLISTGLFFTDILGAEFPILIGGAVIVLRGVVILVSFSIVARTVVWHISTRPQGDDQIEGRGMSLRAEVKDAGLHILIKNYRAMSVDFRIGVQSQSGMISARGDDHNWVIPPQMARPGEGFDETELVIDLDKVGTGGAQDDILEVTVDANPTSPSVEQEYTRVGQFEIPITISEAGEMSSEVIMRKYEAEILE
ncbi:hypothetical protein [Haloarcula brevis]|uniref:hypothetical protein n=1 Tax=Haloarcula brevis TaxID=3111453 RepID=UPI00300E8F28